MKVLSNLPSLLPILNGLCGDKLPSLKPEWAIPMSFRIGEKDISIAKLKNHIRGKHLVLFVHGLMTDESAWNDLKNQFSNKESVLTIRYNTGLHISENGKLLSELTESLQKKYHFASVSLVGHSMGGLVVRSACFYATQGKHRWIKCLRSVYLIAVPNAGAALEKIGHFTTISLKFINRWYLGLVGSLIDQRSNGIKDLRLGSMVDEDWKNRKVSLKSHFKRASVPPITGVNYYILIASLSKNEDSLLAKYFGDGLVTPGSATAETLLMRSTIKTFPRTGHNALLKHKDLIKYLTSQIMQTK